MRDPELVARAGRAASAARAVRLVAAWHADGRGSAAGRGLTSPYGDCAAGVRCWPGPGSQIGAAVGKLSRRGLAGQEILLDRRVHSCVLALLKNRTA
jgi:hypothetical protein